MAQNGCDKTESKKTAIFYSDQGKGIKLFNVEEQTPAFGGPVRRTKKTIDQKKKAALCSLRGCIPGQGVRSCLVRASLKLHAPSWFTSQAVSGEGKIFPFLPLKERFSPCTVAPHAADRKEKGVCNANFCNHSDIFKKNAGFYGMFVAYLEGPSQDKNSGLA